MKARVLCIALVVTVSLMLTGGSAWATDLTTTKIGLEANLSSGDMNDILTEIDNAVTHNDGRITTNEGAITALQTDMIALDARVTAIETALAAFLASNVAKLETYLTVDEASTLRGVAPPNVILEGVNLHVRNSGTTQTVDGLGNLIIGHNENLAGGPVVGRGGSHNIVVGGENEFSSAAGIVAGWQNTISALFATVTGGAVNAAAEVYSSVSGGNKNLANGDLSVVSGGEFNEALGSFSVVSGGELNTAQDAASTVGGGLELTATGINDYVDPDSP